MSTPNTWLVSVRRFLRTQARNVGTVAIYMSGRGAMMGVSHNGTSAFLSTIAGVDVPHINLIAPRFQYLGELGRRLSVLLHRWNSQTRRIEAEVTGNTQSMAIASPESVPVVAGDHAPVKSKSSRRIQAEVAVNTQSRAIASPETAPVFPDVNALLKSEIAASITDGSEQEISNISELELLEKSDEDQHERVISSEADLDSIIVDVKANPDVCYTLHLSPDVSFATVVSLDEHLSKHQFRGVLYGRGFKAKLSEALEIKKKMEQAKKLYNELIASAAEQLALIYKYESMLSSTNISPGTGRLYKKRRMRELC